MLLQFGERLANNLKQAFENVTENWIRLVMIVCMSLLLRPYLIKPAGKTQMPQHEKKTEAKVKLSPNSIQGQLEIPEDSDEADAAETELAKTQGSGHQRAVGGLAVKQVYPDVGGSVVTDVDIFAIHGLDTTSPGTWTFRHKPKKDSPKEGDHKGIVSWVLGRKRKRDDDEKADLKDINWLMSPDMLPHDLRNARIFTCNWPSRLYRNPKTVEMTISELAHALLCDIYSERCQLNTPKNRPVVFIASCLGGIILAKALTLAAEPKSDYKDLRAATAGVVFLGTPFRGTSLADLFGVAMVRLEAGGFFSGQTLARGLLNNLGKSTATLEELVNIFTRSCLDYDLPLYCFYETVKSDLRARSLPKQTPEWLKRSIAQPKLASQPTETLFTIYGRA